MKRFIILVLAVVLLAGGVGGYAYAQTTHEPVVGEKLIGWGALGVDEGFNRTFYTRFVITNPDCVSEVKNIEIRITEDNGTTEYPGKLINPSTSSQLTTLGPHESGVIDLASCVVPSEDVADPRKWERGPYTVEVSWTGTKGGLPLTGWSWLATGTFAVDPGNGDVTFIEDVATSAVSQMVNMTQALGKSK